MAREPSEQDRESAARHAEFAKARGGDNGSAYLAAREATLRRQGRHGEADALRDELGNMGR